MAADLRRRTLLGSALAGVVAATSSHAAGLDLNDPVQNLLAFAKLTGNSAGGAVLRWHTGIINAVQPGEKPVPLVGYEGLEKELWASTKEGGPDGSFTTTYFDIGYFTDLATGERLRRWTNPITKETLPTMPFRSGRFAAALKPGAPPRAWQRRGDDVWVTNRPVVGFPALLKPELYPAESAGPFQFFSVVRTDRGRLSEVSDPKVTSAPLSWSYTLTTIWLPWMRMGQRPGAVVWAGNGGKYAAPGDVPEKFRAFLAEEQPDYLSADEPLQDVRTMWADYMKANPPADGK
ncbi:MAG: DUF1838 family protein [Rhodospirillaceae bacterium]|nr:DUF1838 family protein [Rhodospirillaceae bacterium]